MLTRLFRFKSRSSVCSQVAGHVQSMINLVNLDQNTVVAALSPSQRRQVSLEENWLERVDWFVRSGRPQLQSQVLEAWQALALACIRSEKINQRAAGSPRIYSKLSARCPCRKDPPIQCQGLKFP